MVTKSSFDDFSRLSYDFLNDCGRAVAFKYFRLSKYFLKIPHKFIILNSPGGIV